MCRAERGGLHGMFVPAAGRHLQRDGLQLRHGDRVRQRDDAGRRGADVQFDAAMHGTVLDRQHAGNNLWRAGEHVHGVARGRMRAVGHADAEPAHLGEHQPVLRDLDGGRWVRGTGLCSAVAASRCTMFDGAHLCPPTRPLHTGTRAPATGGRAARARCGTATGASCSGLTLSVGSDYSCSMVTQTVGPGQRKCYRGRRREFARPGLQRRADHADVRGLIDGVRHDRADRHEDRLLPVLRRVGGTLAGFPARRLRCERLRPARRRSPRT